MGLELRKNIFGEMEMSPSGRAFCVDFDCVCVSGKKEETGRLGRVVRRTFWEGKIEVRVEWSF